MGQTLTSVRKDPTHDCPVDILTYLTEFIADDREVITFGRTSHSNLVGVQKYSCKRQLDWIAMVKYYYHRHCHHAHSLTTPSTRAANLHHTDADVDVDGHSTSMNLHLGLHPSYSIGRWTKIKLSSPKMLRWFHEGESEEDRLMSSSSSSSSSPYTSSSSSFTSDSSSSSSISSFPSYEHRRQQYRQRQQDRSSKRRHQSFGIFMWLKDKLQEGDGSRDGNGSGDGSHGESNGGNQCSADPHPSSSTSSSASSSSSSSPPLSYHNIHLIKQIHAQCLTYKLTTRVDVTCQGEFAPHLLPSLYYLLDTFTIRQLTLALTYTATPTPTAAATALMTGSLAPSTSVAMTTTTATTTTSTTASCCDLLAQLQSNVSRWNEIVSLDLYGLTVSLNRLDSVECLPTSLRSLILPYHLNTSALSHIRLPSELTHIDFSMSWDQPISDWPQLPSTLQFLRLGNNFNQSMDGIILPSSLTHIQFGRYFRHSLRRCKWPLELRELDLCNSGQWNLPVIELGHLPSSLETFILSHHFNQPLDQLRLCHTFLHTLIFGTYFNHPLDTLELPSSLTTLKLGWNFNHPIDRVIWPASLTEIHLGFQFNHPLPLPLSSSLSSSLSPSLSLSPVSPSPSLLFQSSHLPPGLRILHLSDVWNHPIDNLTLPPSLTRLHFGSHFSGQVIPSLRSGFWPKSLNQLSWSQHTIRWIKPTRSKWRLSFYSKLVKELYKEKIQPFTLSAATSPPATSALSVTSTSTSTLTSSSSSLSSSSSSSGSASSLSLSAATGTATGSDGSGSGSGSGISSSSSSSSSSRDGCDSVPDPRSPLTLVDDGLIPVFDKSQPAVQHSAMDRLEVLRMIFTRKEAEKNINRTTL